ncbi:MAG: Holliday junction resolvase RuvX [Clostridia bacterium]|nr:Holliday junction resolvase RuvX [Clostridia bacterium]
MGRVLGVDYGEVRVGVAVSDPLRFTANGLETLVINGSMKKFLSGIRKISKEYEVEEIVIGYPKNMDGTISEKAKTVDRIIPELEKIVKKVTKIDERLTTVSSYKTMKELGISQKEKNTYADKFAAMYILETYLNMENNINNNK